MCKTSSCRTQAEGTLVTKLGASSSSHQEHAYRAVPVWMNSCSRIAEEARADSAQIRSGVHVSGERRNQGARPRRSAIRHPQPGSSGLRDDSARLHSPAQQLACRLTIPVLQAEKIYTESPQTTFVIVQPASSFGAGGLSRKHWFYLLQLTILVCTWWGGCF